MFPKYFPWSFKCRGKYITYPMLVVAGRAIVNHTRLGDLIPHSLDITVQHIVASKAQTENYSETVIIPL
jgi:hypothetical protein